MPLDFSFLYMDRLATVGGPEGLVQMLTVLSDAVDAGIEFNLTEPLGVDPDDLERTLERTGLVVPSFLTGVAYHDGLCLSAPDPARRFGAIHVVGLLPGTRRDEPDAMRRVRVAATYGFPPSRTHVSSKRATVRRPVRYMFAPSVEPRS